MTDPAHLNAVHACAITPLSKRLIEVFREAVRDPSIANADYVQRLKNEMEAALEEGQQHAAGQPHNP
jgi:hypothetical protein